MRLSFMLAVMTAITYFVACTAAADSDVTMDSPDLVRSLDATKYIDGARRKLLRGHKDSETEERGLADWLEKSNVKKLAKEILKDYTKGDAAYTEWAQKGYTLDKMKKLLDIEKKDKYLSVYNDYVSHLYQL
ncbi:hypothetical protein F442_22023 [Phytophthora nicotianae P10297]|uniref:RxLR effector protein n=3 Tax=Phytophthora nicotianae TaxID=4792 RepID=W2PDW9_PHYN3|nr:hypothetical protein PPTG_24440 [Phytophthora nicotianae INRA-310]ETL77815.1 hypothetical protein L917_21268 [Phytophthora nicotianae]ETP28695.1 hypothetical protein F442_22023 [Phytophthora nicotianae P10297]KUF78541.1 hypothetical protein AM587_10001477 [Phytophthora nicotianae]ETM99257.1 hypothetical protein PPTG_24440 [Phytophthora nicotianae INRA-310]KUF80746.1 hypothetical protein AM588_10000190 [Phytophthora nicotianae]